MVLGPPLFLLIKVLPNPRTHKALHSPDKEGRCNLSIWMFQGMFSEVCLEAR